MIRLDRFVTLHYFKPLRELWPGKDPAIPVLMYHGINAAHERGHPYYRVNTSPKVFADHMNFLATQGYRTITLQELNDKEFVGKTVAITFDDGFSDFYFKAFPILKEHGFRATVFLITASVGESFNGRKCLDWEQIRELHTAGMMFGSHTHTHPQLIYLDRSTIVQELGRSKSMIEDKLGCAVTDFSYPFRFPEENREFKGLIVEELISAGYARCVTTIIGRYRAGDDSMLIKRLPVNSDDDETFLDAKMKGDHDWLRTPQYIAKWVRSIIS